MKQIILDINYFEHLLNCLANQKFINQFNADATEVNKEQIDKQLLSMQDTIDKAWNDGMDKLSDIDNNSVYTVFDGVNAVHYDSQTGTDIKHINNYK